MQLRQCRVDLWTGRTGEPYDPIRVEPLHGIGRQVFLAHVNTVTAAEYCQVGTVVHNDDGAGFVGQRHGLFRLLPPPVYRDHLFPQLDQADTLFQEVFHLVQDARPALIEGRSDFLLYWLDRFEAISDQVLVATHDGSRGEKDGYPGMVERLLASGETLDRVIAIGCTFMMYKMAETTRRFGVKTIVSLNPIMIDGTGMCGACRVSVGNETKFACVDGPDFDAHQVDWDLLLSRRTAYLGSETDSADRPVSPRTEPATLG